jgi:hypothetical protein
MTKEEIIEMAWNIFPISDREKNETFIELLVHFVQAIAEKEREACAKIAENRILHDKNENIKKGYFYAQQSIAQDIRARGKE